MTPEVTEFLHVVSPTVIIMLRSRYELDRETAALERLRAEGRIKAVAQAKGRIDQIRDRAVAAGTEAAARKRESGGE